MNYIKETIKKKHLLAVLLLVFLSVKISICQDNNLNEGQGKANEILLKARNAINQKGNDLKIQGISLDFAVSRNVKFVKNNTNTVNQSQQDGEKELNSVFPGKFRYSETLSSNSTSVYQFILNDNQLKAESYGISDGKRIEFQVDGAKPLSEEQKATQILVKKKEIFFMLFPILLESRDFSSLEFKYIGKAESNNERADILEAVFDEESKIRLFFDEQTHLLKMMIRNIQNSQSESEEKRFYSDYKTVEGLMIPNKINIETKQSSKDRHLEIFEEQTLRSAKINPTFKPNIFEVKGN